MTDSPTLHRTHEGHMAFAPATSRADGLVIDHVPLDHSMPGANPLPEDAWPADLDRRRPGRSDDVSPELIALMRKPTAEARLKVMLYDAPHFVLPEPERGRVHAPGHTLHVTLAFIACTVVWAVAFRGMMMLWG